jgi:hypothetical protein
MPYPPPAPPHRPAAIGRHLAPLVLVLALVLVRVVRWRRRRAMPSTASSSPTMRDAIELGSAAIDHRPANGLPAGARAHSLQATGARTR